MSSANETQVGGEHYRAKGLQHWDLMAQYNIPYLEGNGSKYIYRWESKGGLQDLQKCEHYLVKIIEMVEHEGYYHCPWIPPAVLHQFFEDNNVRDMEASIFTALCTWRTNEELEVALHNVRHLMEMVQRQTSK